MELPQVETGNTTKLHTKVKNRSCVSEDCLDTNTLDCTAGLTPLTKDVPLLVQVLDSPRQPSFHGTVPFHHLHGKFHVRVVVLRR